MIDLSSQLAPMSSISLLDSMWVMWSAILVIFMTVPGLALFYGGLVRKKNVISTLMKSFAICAIITIVWACVGYSLAFSDLTPFVGGFSKLFLHGIKLMPDAHNLITVNQSAPKLPESVYFLYSLSFAIIAPALITGGFVERMKFTSCVLFSILWSICVYAPIAHMVWGHNGWLANSGVLDFAGGTVVHITSGVAGLVAAVKLGKRVGIDEDNTPILPYNLVFAFIGAAILWIGWFGFNGGSTYGFGPQAVLAIVNTQVAAASGFVAWIVVEAIHSKPSVIGGASGAIAGLVAITPGAGYVELHHAIVMGMVASVACYYACTKVKNWLGYDDALDAFGIHGVGGIIGAILTGVFATKELAGFQPSVLMQCKGVLVTIIYTAVVTIILLKVVELIMGLRVTRETELLGLDTQHGSEVDS